MNVNDPIIKETMEGVGGLVDSYNEEQLDTLLSDFIEEKENRDFIISYTSDLINIIRNLKKVFYDDEVKN